AGQESGEGTEAGEEPAEEHYLAAVAVKEIAADLQTRPVQAEDVRLAVYEVVSKAAADPEANVVAGDRPERGGRNHQLNVEAMCGAGVNAGGDQRGFAG